MSPSMFLSLGRVEAVALSPDGQRLVAAVKRPDDQLGRFRSTLFAVDLAAPDQARPLCEGSSPTFRADGTLLYLRAEDPEKADSRLQVWARSATGPEQLTDEPLGVLAFRAAGEALVVLAPWLPDVPAADQRAAVEDRREHGPSALHYRDMPVRFWKDWLGPTWPHLIAWGPTGRRDLTPGFRRELVDGHWDLAADGSALVTTRARPGADRLPDVDLVHVDLHTGALRSLGAEAGVEWSLPRLSPDGRVVAAARHARRSDACGRPELCTIDVQSGQWRSLTPHWDHWPEPAGWTPDGRQVLLTAQVRGSTRLFAADLQSEQVLPWTSSGTIDVQHVAAGHVVALQHGLLQPPLPLLLPLPSNGPAAPPRLLVEAAPTLVGALDGGATWSRFDVTDSAGDEVDVLWVRPADAGAAPLPTLLWVHGGPFSHWADWWHWRWNPLPFVAAGYAVAMPNPAGSLGYGQDRVEQAWGNTWGGACTRQVLAVADALAQRPDVDRTRIGAMGASFGGYMMNWLGGTTDRFACIVSQAGIFALSAFHGTTDWPAYWALHTGSTPYDGVSVHDRFSPQRRVAGWRSPTLVIAGEKDYRVPIGEALAHFEGLQLHGVPSELLVFPDEGHWIERPRNVVAWHETILDFLARHMT